MEDQAGNPNAATTLGQSLELRETLAAERPSSVNAKRDVAITHFLRCALHLRHGDTAEALAACEQSFELRNTLYRADPKNSQLVGAWR